jgi:formylglycine-generating enzyme required for sulfatase activity
MATPPATANVTQTYEAAQQIAGLTLTAQLPGFTPVTRNADWAPVTQDFDGVTMVLVPVGCFDMGDDPESYNGENQGVPAGERQCFEQPFWLDLTEVTQADFERLGGQKANPNAFDGEQRPVESITWFEARDFCALRGMRLPTEREWEYAARGPDNRIYPWGNDWNPESAVWSGNSEGQTATVGSRPAGVSWVGALDMSGNVSEWVSSLYQDYPYVPDDGREADTDNSTNVRRVLRGGSWNYALTSPLRAPARVWGTPNFQDGDVGFRCARSS